jgi:hypothetical protein
MVTVKAYSKKELAVLYGIDLKTLNRWIIGSNIFEVNYYTNIKLFMPIEVEKIFTALGRPNGNTYRKSTLAADYGVDVRTLNRWIMVNEIFPKKEYQRIHIFKPIEAAKIFEVIGAP